MDFDLPAYLKRIDYSGDLHPCHSVLEAIHFAHGTRIPFENLDLFLERPIRLDMASVQEKLVRSERGGYCFEQNLLLASALQAVGFSVTRLTARVRYRATRLLPRTHMMLLVESDERRWLADVGFGSEGLLLPVLFEPGYVVRHFAWTYRIMEESDRWVLQSLRNESWIDLYAFTLEPQEQVDYELANYYVSTHPDSRMRQTLIVRRATAQEQHILRNRELIRDCGDNSTSRLLTDESEVLDVLEEVFGLSFPPGTRFRFPWITQ